MNFIPQQSLSAVRDPDAVVRLLGLLDADLTLQIAVGEPLSTDLANFVQAIRDELEAAGDDQLGRSKAVEDAACLLKTCEEQGITLLGGSTSTSGLVEGKTVVVISAVASGERGPEWTIGKR